MENAELERIKIKLLKETSALEKELKEQESIGHQQLSSLAENAKEDYMNKSSLEENNKLCDFSHHLTGIMFKDAKKDWIDDKIYKYTANVVTKAISFYLELTMDLKDDPDFEVIDITCHFMDVPPCFMLEMTPWVQFLAKLKNFSFFMSAISDYSQYNVLRNKIVNSLHTNNYINFYDHEEGNGGILLDLRSPKNPDQIYLKYQWSLKFFEKTCHIEHYFTINATEFGMEFVEANTSLLKQFCKLNLKKKDLIELWAQLCTAIDIYEDKNI
ncbi:uncharacterized protein LOC124954308 [Vespa velutina]|uniref:uncharacterized protein LOC124954308 n=1 Tax=Vespa velutina TaxID=202808 RepID=UPI001FB2622A|nr:uncharacterized protein LOC124954308 [Vespa velutina]